MVRDEGKEHPKAIDALDAYWEELLSRAGKPEHEGTGANDIHETIDRLYALDDAPHVSSRFVRELEGRLMERSAAGAGQSLPADSLPRSKGASGSIRGETHGGERRRPSFASLAALAALLLLTLTAGFFAFQRDNSGPRPTEPTDQGFMFQPGEASPTAADCDVPPRLNGPAESAGTPPPPPISASGELVLTHLWLEPGDIPTGEAASAEERAGVTATIHEFVACELRAREAEGDWEGILDARSRQFALFTDDYLRRHVDPEPEPTAAPGTPTVSWWSEYAQTAEWSPGAEMPQFRQVIRMPNGRIGALLVDPAYDSGTYVVFARVGDRWLVDEVAFVSPEALRGGTPSPDELARSGPALTLILADIVYTPPQLGMPPDTNVALTLANTGQARHSFNIDALDIHIELQPGESTTIVVNAPAGTYEFWCSVPGHKEAGMTGILTVDPTYRLPGRSAEVSGQEAASPTSPSP